MGILLDFHLFFIWTTIAVVLFSDEQGLLWIRGYYKTLPKERVEWLHSLVIVGLVGLITSGGLMFLRFPSMFLSNSDFLIKMFFVLVLIINSFFVGRFARLSTEREWASLRKRERTPIILSGVISAVSWAVVIICGLLLH